MGERAHCFIYLYSYLVPQQIQDGCMNGDTAIQRGDPKYPVKSQNSLLFMEEASTVHISVLTVIKNQPSLITLSTQHPRVIYIY